MDKNSKIYIAGHTGLVGSAIKRKLEEEGYNNLIFRTSSELDLEDQSATKKFFMKNKPEYVFIAAAKTGGIHANTTYRADFIYKNLQIENNLIHYSWKSKAKKLLYLGSSCIYPRECKQPMKEEYLLTGSLEPTNEPYAIAKIAGLKMCEAYNKQYGTNFISLVPCSIYGPNDNFNPYDSHVISALILKFHDAKENNLPSVELWGTGKARREFMYVEDAADAILYFMQNYDHDEIDPYVNIGSGNDMSINQLALLIKDIIGYKGKIRFDSSKPDGMPRKQVDISRASKLGWKAKISLRDGIGKTYEWFREQKR